MSRGLCITVCLLFFAAWAQCFEGSENRPDNSKEGVGTPSGQSSEHVDDAQGIISIQQVGPSSSYTQEQVVRNVLAIVPVPLEGAQECKSENRRRLQFPERRPAKLQGPCCCERLIDCLLVCWWRDC